MQTPKSPEVHDVVIIGTGASGGMAAWNLTRQGLRVLMLDAGTKFPRSQFWSHVKPWEVPAETRRGPEASAVLRRPEDRALPTLRRDSPSTWCASGAAAARPTSGAASPCATPISISPAPSATAGRFPGRSATRTSLRITTRSISSSACAAAMTTRTRCPAAATTCRLPLRAAANGCCRRRRATSASRSSRDAARCSRGRTTATPPATTAARAARAATSAPSSIRRTT